MRNMTNNDDFRWVGSEIYGNETEIGCVVVIIIIITRMRKEIREMLE